VVLKPDELASKQNAGLLSESAAYSSAELRDWSNTNAARAKALRLGC